MELDSDKDLYWVAREGLMAPLPKNWKPCKTKDTEDIYYFNFATGESTWDHPCDGYYKRLYEEEKKKKETNAKESGDQNRTKAKADVEQLLGTKEKKKKMKKVSGLTDLAPPGPGGKPGPGGIATLGSLERKPLPGISSLSKPAFSQPLSLAKPLSVNSSSLTSKNLDNQPSIQPKTSNSSRASFDETDSDVSI
jgi:centrosomal protein CEP164